jgi:RNA polymerase sigma-70 factor (ECF subfamily)
VLPTSISLLDRLKGTAPSSGDWKRLQEIYSPLIHRWIRGIPGLEGEADDLAQDVLMVLLREIPKFERQREGSFRAWLRQVTVNRIRTCWKQKRRRPVVGLDRTDGYLEQLADSEGDLAKQWDQDHDRHVLHKLLAVVEPDFTPSTWAAFRRFALDGHPAARVADELGLTENAVIQAKSRILRRLRQEAGDLVD